MLKVFNVEYAKAVMAQEPKVFTKTTMKLYGFIGIAFLSSSLNGYDAVVMGGINAMKQYQE